MKRLPLFLLLVAASLAPAGAADRKDAIPVDDKVITGRLDNGLVYIIRENGKPEKKAELRLVVRAGSVLEEDSEKGFAHFCEHMAFNGTRTYKKNELITYLQSLGAGFGPDLNAYTSFDETVYRITIPTDKPENLASGLLMLEDWGFHVTYESEEIKKEKGVVFEEWRQGRDAATRMVHAAFPTIFYGSLYGQRLPIGDMEILAAASDEDIRGFYKKWYRPELMAVIVVGDVDGKAVEQDIIRRFGGYSNPAGSPKRTMVAVPDHKDTLYVSKSDPEADFAAVQVFNMYAPQPLKKKADYRAEYAETLYLSMFNSRLDERALTDADPPYVYAYVSIASYTEAKYFHNMVVVAAPENLTRGYMAAAEEAEKVRRHGFTQTELDRARADLYSRMEKQYRERDTIDSAVWTDLYVSHVLDGRPIPPAEYEWAVCQEILPKVTLADIKKIYTPLLSPKNRVVFAMQPEAPGLVPVDNNALKTIHDGALALKVEPYRDVHTEGDLVKTPPAPGSVVSKSVDKETGIHTWVLSNGATVLIKPTAFKSDEILFAAWSPGGESLVSDKDYWSAQVAGDLTAETGVAGWGRQDLDRLLAGQNVMLSASLSPLSEDMEGQASVKDFETLLKLVYLYFTDPRADQKSWDSFLSRLKAQLVQRDADPRTRYYDRFKEILYSGHLRARPLTSAALPMIDPRRSHELFRERFRYGSDFTFIFVGNIDPVRDEAVLLTWLGGLPAGPKETWKDTGTRYTKTGAEESMVTGKDPVGIIILAWPGNFEWSYTDTYRMIALADVLQIRLEEKIREESSGSYSIGVSVSPSRYPAGEYCFFIHFYCDPERADELIKLIEQEIALLKEKGIDPRYVTDAATAQKVAWRDGLQDNAYWLRNIKMMMQYDLPMGTITTKDKVLYDTLTPQIVRDTAVKYMRNESLIKLIMYPEGFY
jgi:zinc protease